jgi:hypothetical protein
LHGDAVVVKMENDVKLEFLDINDQPYWRIEDGTPAFLKFPVSDNHGVAWIALGNLLARPVPPPFAPKDDPLDAYMDLCDEIDLKRRAYTHCGGLFLPSVNAPALLALDAFPDYPSWDSFLAKHPGVPPHSHTLPSDEDMDANDRSSLPPSSPPLTSSTPLLSSPVGLHINLRSLDDREEEEEKEEEEEEDEERQKLLGASSSVAGSSRPTSPAKLSSSENSPLLFDLMSCPQPSSSTSNTALSDNSDLYLSVKPSTQTSTSAPENAETRFDMYTNPSFGPALVFPSPLNLLLFASSFSGSHTIAPPSDLPIQQHESLFCLDGTYFTLDERLVDSGDRRGRLAD